MADKQPQTVAMIDKLGRTVGVQDNQVEAALKKGFSLESEDQARVRAAVEDNKGIGGTLKVGAASALNELALGVPEAIYRHTADEKSVQEWDAIKADHAVADTVMGAAGFGVGLLAGPGKLVAGAGTRAAEKIAARTGLEAATSIGGKLVRGAVAGAAETAALSAPRALTEAVLGDPYEAGESFLIATAAGGALGSLNVALGEATAWGGKRTQQALRSYAGLEAKVAEEATEKTLKDQVIDKAKDLITNKAVGTVAKAVGVGALVHTNPAVAVALSLVPKEFKQKVAGQIAEAGVDKAGIVVGDFLKSHHTRAFTDSVATMIADDAKPPKAGYSDPLKKLLGPEAKESDADNVELIAKKLAAWQADPFTTTQQIQAVTGQLGASAPAAANHAVIATNNALGFLATKVPRPPTMAQAPFAPPQPKQPPNAGQVRSFKRTVGILVDPAGTIHHAVTTGTLSTDHVEALEAFYPRYASRVKQQLMDNASKPVKSVIKRQHLSTLLGTDPSADPDLSVGLNVQMVYAGSKQPGGSPGTKPVAMPGAEPTSTNRIASGMPAPKPRAVRS